jgi:23S rRNA (cytidine1920-2'-O)/16S rRNA (cytidine1409-2'-O)-methyltransferase
VSPKQRARFVALISLLRRRYPDVADPAALVRHGRVLVDGAPAFNPRAQVRSDASVRLVRTRPLRGTIKLRGALDAFTLDVAGTVAVDLGAAAGGFTRALLDAGAARVYAVDAGVGQLRGALRVDPRVINLEGTNLAGLDDEAIPECVDLVTMDLSYLPVADAVPQLDRLILAARAQLVALVKPTFELRARTLAARPEDVALAVASAKKRIAASRWEVLDEVSSPIPGSRGAIEVFVHARRTEAGA